MASTHTETKKQAFLKALNPLKEPWAKKMREISVTTS